MITEIDSQGGRRVDYIFMSQQLESYVHRAEVISSQLAQKASQHLPVVADLQIDYFEWQELS